MSQKEPSALLRCPFCGSPAEYDSQRYMPPTREEYRGQTGHTITCSICEAEIGLFDCYEDARDAWNKRAAQAVAAHAREPDEERIREITAERDAALGSSCVRKPDKHAMLNTAPG